MRAMRGQVFIAPVAAVPADGSMVDPERSRFWASWHDDNHESGVEIIEVDGAEAAIAWGRERSQIVLIRLGHRGDTYFSAGTTPVEHDDGPMPLWPPTAPPNGWWQPRTGER